MSRARANGLRRWELLVRVIHPSGVDMPEFARAANTIDGYRHGKPHEGRVVLLHHQSAGPLPVDNTNDPPIVYLPRADLR